MHNLKKYIPHTIVIMLLGLLIAWLLMHNYQAQTKLPTYFSYNEAELKVLETLNSDEEISTQSLQKWDSILLNLIKENKFGDILAARTYAYLYVAQRDAAYISMNQKHHFMGSIDIVSAQTLCLFFPKQCTALTSSITYADPYSKELATLVINKIKIRIMQDNKGTHLYPEKSSNHYWKGIRPYYGQDAGSWMPWIMGSVDTFVAPMPPAYDSPEWQHQLKMTKEALEHITPEQTKAVVFWAGNPGTATPPGVWIMFANEYMFAQQTSLTKMLLVRSVLAMGIADAAIAVFNSKYTYWVKRPFMLDPTIITVMPTPNHPSYPAGHSTISSAAATILSYFFPSNKLNWVQKEHEASMSRVWGGIHFTIDAQQGDKLGKRVGDAAIADQTK